MKLLLFILLSFGFYLSAISQKFGYVDTEHVLKKVPQYKEAILEIDQLSVEQQKKIDKMY